MVRLVTCLGQPRGNVIQSGAQDRNLGGIEGKRDVTDMRLPLVDDTVDGLRGCAQQHTINVRYRVGGRTVRVAWSSRNGPARVTANCT